ncbi:hypothetical protein ACFQ3L_09270 [Lacticaseibacillus jixianensis]|uniref:Uncharacterized protein n=1 Tax=Lacticaseibacillus jixianensis TaxID=2486012 RepID=A0ABW4BA13_9LACO|nr:hypothetical protein [Lacticaseibacillus jixianensis]
MKKWLMIASAVFVLILAGCQKRQADYAEVYNAAGQRVATVKKAAGIKKLSAIAGRLGSAKKATLSAHAKIAYRYVLHEVKSGHQITLSVYRGENAVKVKNIPVLGVGPWRISQADAATLDRPSSLK